MSLYVLDAFIWILGIRGHIPQSGEFGPLRAESSFGASAGALMRALAVFIGRSRCCRWCCGWPSGSPSSSSNRLPRPSSSRSIYLEQV